ncbi:hypothetical protein V5E97_08350 [Singulisphaera sp. Ch08]|uniref:Uncharacterized protein n=1 Tax=Singulisphaera sp. Ch08 TaxID=3120278 RepID=A0AAU7CN23_9BACT
MRLTVKEMMVIVAVIAGTLWLVDSTGVAVGDGGYHLAVRVRSASGSSIRAVTCEAFGSDNDAKESLERLIPPGSSSWAASADPFTGKELSVNVPVSTRSTGLGRIVSDFQFRSLLVIVTYGDGRRIGKVVTIPHRDVTQSVSVEFP